MRPGINTIAQESTPTRTPPTATDQTLAAGVVERGPTGVVIDINSFEDAKRKLGARFAWTARTWDAIESFFKYGGRKLRFSRIVGPAAVKAFVNLDDAVGGAPFALVARAVGEGDWYNSLNVIVSTDGGTGRGIQITHDTDSSVNESSGIKTTQQELVDWARVNSKYINLEFGGSVNMPAAGTFNLAGGTDDRASITDVHRLAALVVFDPDIGAAQVAIPGATTQTAWEGILQHCNDNADRTAILAYPDTSDESTLTTLANAVREFGHCGGGFAGWLIEPFGNTTKTVSPELAICAKIAVRDSTTPAGLAQNKPAAGVKYGVLDRCLGITQAQSATWKDKDARERLNAAGVNLLRERFGGVVIYGWHSLADPESEEQSVNLGHRRLYMALSAKLNAVLEEYMFEDIDGQGRLLGKINGSVTGRVVDPYFQVGSLYGASAAEAYRVDTDSVNDDVTAQNKQVGVALTVVESEFAEEINVYIIKKLITEGVGA